jgi:hypothetical protein
MAGLMFSDLILRDVVSAVLITFNNYTVYVDGPAEPAPLQSMRNFLFSNFQITGKASPKESAKPMILLTGLPGHSIENVAFRNFSITAPGGGSVADGEIRSLPELHRVRPEFTQFGKVVPAYGLYARHVRGLVLDRVTFNFASPEHRPAVVCDDVIDLDFSEGRVAISPDAAAAIRLQNVQRAWIRNSRPRGGSKAFLQVEGAESREILLSGNDLRDAETAFSLAAGAARDAVTAAQNIK